MATGFEPELVRAQVARHAGIFACSEAAVFSASELDLGFGVQSTQFPEDASAVAGWGSWLNTQNFLLAWHRVTTLGQFLRYDWTVKVDPDTVFFPDRLRLHLHKLVPAFNSKALYIKNCPKEFGLLGPIEVFSRAAVRTYGTHEAECSRIAHVKSTGEDGYIHACMEMLGVQSIEDFQLLTDNYCSYGNCSSSGWSVAFHPYKTTQQWIQCWKDAKHAK